MLKTVVFPICHHHSIPVELSFSFLQPAQSMSAPHVSQSLQAALSRRRTDNVVAEQGLSCREIQYFNADPQKYDLVVHVLF